jgi:fucose 4-O-acetylase-like acetyltransferase
MNTFKIISSAILIFFGGLFLVGFLTEESLVLYGNPIAITACSIALLIGIVLLIKSKF